MKKHLSVFTLAARCSLSKVLLVFLAAGVVETILFFRLASSSSGHARFYLEDLINNSYIPIANMVFAMILIFILSSAASVGKSKQEYIFKRMQLNYGFIYIWWTLYNMICLMAYKAFQLALMMVLLTNHLSEVTYAAGGQTLFLAFYRNSFLHSLMPMENILGWIINIFIIFLLASSTTETTLFSNKRGLAGAILQGFIWTSPVMIKGLYSNNGTNLLVIFMIIAGTAALIFSCFRIFESDGRIFDNKK